jgi:hypothetical protein
MGTAVEERARVRQRTGEHRKERKILLKKN